MSPGEMVCFEEIKDRSYFVIEGRGFGYRISKTFKIILLNVVTIEFQLLKQIQCEMNWQLN